MNASLQFILGLTTFAISPSIPSTTYTERGFRDAPHITLPRTKVSAGEVANLFALTTENKHRIYVAVYYRGGITMDPDARDRLGKAKYHWGIWIQKRGEKKGAFFEATKEDVFHNVSDSGGWKYKHGNRKAPSVQLLLLVMIGKLPENIPVSTVDTVLRKVAMPNDSSDEGNCVTWTQESVKAMQMRHWVDNELDIQKMFDFAMDKAERAYKRNKELSKPAAVVNFTKRHP